MPHRRKEESRLAVTTTAALSGTYGLAVTMNDTQTLYVEDETPDGETSYQVRFALDPNSFSLNGGNHSIFQAFKNPNLSVINIDLGGQPDVPDYQITVAARHEDNTWLLSPAFSISDGVHAVEIGWGMASGPKFTDGWLRLWLDGELVYEYTQLANFGQRINTVQLGAVLAPLTDASGTYCLDAFVSAQQGYIGPGEGLSPCGMGMIASMPKTFAMVKQEVNAGANTAPVSRLVFDTSIQLRDDRDVFLEHLVSTSSIITITYTYDDLSRVSAADYSNGSSFSYAYDGAGNLLSFSRWSGGEVEMVSFVYNGANQIDCLDGDGNGTCGDPEDVPYTYDPYGNLTSDGARTYSYDAENRLVSVTDGVSTTTYAYNGDGDRVSQTVDGVTTSYVIDVATPLTMALAETTGAETIYSLSVDPSLEGNGLDLIGQSDGVSMEYFTYDGLGSVRQVVDGAGEVLYAQGFDPYGNLYLNAGDEKPNWGFTGEQSDENGLVFLRARYYEPRQGRFLSRDPFSGSVDYPATLNPYIYALNNPLLHTDPNGENPLLAALIPALVGLGATMAGGAIATGAYGYVTYNWALTGECGCEIQQQAASMTRWEWTGIHALSGGIIAGTATAMAAAGPAGLIVMGGVGVVVSVADFHQTVQIIKNETGITACTVTRLMFDVAGAVLSVVGIREGVRAWRTSGSGLGWGYKYQAIAPPSDRSELRKSLGSPPSNMSNPEAHHNLPWKYREWFAGEGRGLNVNDPKYGRWVEGNPQGTHQTWTILYENEWANFIANNPSATRTEVLSFLDHLIASGRFP